MVIAETKLRARFLSRLWRVFLLLFLMVPLPGAMADQRPVVIPKHNSTFQQRAAAIITVNACGRELEYLRATAAMAVSDHSGQGEDLLALLTAKVAWLHAGRGLPTACESTIEFLESEEAEWSRSTSPTVCALEKSRDVSDRKVTVSVSVSPACMQRQVNEAIRAMSKTGRMGTDVPCLDPRSLDSGGNGEWDVQVRALVRILYMGRYVLQNGQPILEKATTDMMYARLLSAREALGPASYDPTVGCEGAGEALGLPEDSADRPDWDDDLLVDRPSLLVQTQRPRGKTFRTGSAGSPDRRLFAQQSL